MTQKVVSISCRQDGELADLGQPGYYAATAPWHKRRAGKKPPERLVDRASRKGPAIRFFSQEEAPLLSAVIDRVMPQDDRAEGRTIPILPDSRRTAFQELAQWLSL